LGFAVPKNICLHRSFDVYLLRRGLGQTAEGVYIAAAYSSYGDPMIQCMEINKNHFRDEKPTCMYN